VERWDIYSHEWRDGIYTAMSGRDGIHVYSHEWRDGIYTAMSGEMGYIQQ
jgi:hypothetical protein